MKRLLGRFRFFRWGVQQLAAIFAARFFVSADIDGQLAALADFYAHWYQLESVVQANHAGTGQKLRASRAKLRSRQDVKPALLDVFCEENRVFLANGVVEFPANDMDTIWTLLHEILVEEAYYFETDVTAPRILDCGAHVGLAIYYFKNLYPLAHITSFEPEPVLRELAQKNMRYNGYENVEILPYALSDADGEATLYLSAGDTMAASLTERRRPSSDSTGELTVACCRLSSFLSSPIHFLKLDVEGMEDVVLAEARSYLHHVQHLFCEYHHGGGLATDRLGKLLQLLDEAGFDVRVGQSHSRQPSRAIVSVGQPYSLAIWAKNRNWQE